MLCFQDRFGPGPGPSAFPSFNIGFGSASSTSFANPAVTIARGFSNTFAGINPADVAAFVAVQLTAAALATLFFRWHLKDNAVP